jgi:hypothetical protein
LEEVPVKKLLLAAAAGALMAACAEAPTSPSTPAGVKANKANADFTCRSGYIIAYDEDGNPYCVPVGDGGDGFAARRPGLSSK